MEYKEFSGKTIDDALTAASVTLGVTSDQITYEVVEKGSNGLFGIGSKDAVIKAAIKVEEEVDQIKEDFVNNDVKVESPKAEADHKEEKSVDSATFIISFCLLIFYSNDIVRPLPSFPSRSMGAAGLSKL
jgi:spoIIIJ-associated protein